MSLTHSPSIVTDGLILYLDAANKRSYPGDGNIWYDLSGTNNNAVLYNAEYFIENNIGYLRNSGNISNFFYVTIPHSSTLNNTFTTTVGAWTIEEIIWTNSVIYPEADAGSVASNIAYGINNTGFDWNHGALNTTFKFGQSSNAPSSSYEDQGNITVPSPYNALNIWKIRTMIWNRGNNLNSLYINSDFIGSTSTPNTSGTSIYDGGGITFGTLYGWKHYGRRSIIKIYNRALSEMEIKQNFNAVRSRFGI